MGKQEKNITMPSVLAFEKKLVLSDGYMYGTTWEERENSAEPLHLAEKSVRGTISNRLKGAVKNDPAKLNAEVEKPNLQTVDACALRMNQDTLKLEFSMKVLSGIETPSACNNMEFSEKYHEVAKDYIKRTGFRELARRYALNIANGRFLWRNRLGAEKIDIRVKVEGETLAFDAYEFSLKNFDSANDKAARLGEFIAQALSGERPYVLLDVEAYVLLGAGQEVYPSEELVFDKGKGDKSKILYQVDGIAAMHSQKLGNAIRTIDTWYPEFSSGRIGPIAIEPYGAVTNLGKAYRCPSEKADFYTLFDRYAVGESLENGEQEDYVMAVLVRGGVFGGKE
ncbi:MAG: type I-F CRISPR-associated protein Csy3 [Selenomonadaceae bacterium]|nr:type I-F CRISPR-associated protein Csy3 [Selenomonadaceae bacterium]